MKDSFILEGKKYISSRRASDISDYSSDYIGQLCRGEKLDCKMIGRTWFVTEESLHLHKANVVREEGSRNRIQNIYKGTKNTSSSDSNNDQVAGVTNTAWALATALANFKNNAKSESGAFIPHKSAVQYEADSRPLLPIFAKKNVPSEDEFNKPSVVSSTVSSQAASSIPSLPANFVTKPRRSYQSLVREVILKRALVPGIVVAVFIMSFAVSAGILAHNVGASANLASLSSIGTKGIADFFVKTYHTLATRGSRPLAVATNESSNPISGQTASSSLNFQGIAVVSSSGQASMDEATKDAIKSSFSDDVSVAADKSGTAGVITPEFKKTDGKNFIYVLVPVKHNEIKN